MNKLFLTEEQERLFVHLPIKQAVYVTSTYDDTSSSDSELLIRVTEVSNFLADLFGGYSTYDIKGAYVTKKSHSLISEKITRVVSFSDIDTFNQNKEKLFEQISLWARDWKQETIGYEYEDDLYYIPAKK